MTKKKSSKKVTTTNKNKGEKNKLTLAEVRGKSKQNNTKTKSSDKRGTNPNSLANLTSRGFAAMSPDRLKEVASKGGHTANANKKKLKDMDSIVKLFLNSNITSAKQKKGIIDLLGENAEGLEITNFMNVMANLLREATGEPSKTKVKAISECLTLGREFLGVQHNASAWQGLPITSIAPIYGDFFHNFKRRENRMYVLEGGRGGGKSVQVAKAIIDDIETNEKANWVAVMKYSNKLKDGAYSQLVKTISELGLAGEYVCTRSPMHIVKTATQQEIKFSGLDNAEKTKSATTQKAGSRFTGMWVEEADQLSNSEDLNTAKRSYLRGNDEADDLKSVLVLTFNTVLRGNHWIETYIKEHEKLDSDLEQAGEQANTIYHRKINYIDLPAYFLGKEFMQGAKDLQKINNVLYEQSYLGIRHDYGRKIFHNLKVEPVSMAKIGQLLDLNAVFQGMDYGTDATTMLSAGYDSKTRTIYVYKEMSISDSPTEENTLTHAKIFKELVANKFSPDLQTTVDTNGKMFVTAAKEKGWNMVSAKKGPGSRKETYDFLQSCTHIVVDPSCTMLIDQMENYVRIENEQGEVLVEYPTKADAKKAGFTIMDHLLDALRYLIEAVAFADPVRHYKKYS